MKVVIMAGGEGTRLRPLTFSIPKPLLPVKDKPILENIIYRLKSCGLKELILAVGYKSELIETYFHNGKRFGVKIKYFKEKNFAQAGLEFQKVLEKYPESKWADNAQFGLGLIYEELGEYQKAVEELGKVVTNYPKADKASNALFGIGEIYERKLKNNSQAIDAYQKLTDDYPGSRWAPMARERIERLRKEEKR